MSLATLHYLPSIAFFRAIATQRTLLIEQHDRWQKASYRNRTTIANANGLQTLSIPVVGGRGQKTNYNEVQICYAENWQHQHWQSIISAYHSAPFFEHYAPYFEPLYKKETKGLFDFNLDILRLLVRFCKLDLAIYLTEAYEKGSNGKQDIRLHFSPQNLIENAPSYHQVFQDKNGFFPQVSVLDLIFNEGPMAGEYLKLD